MLKAYKRAKTLNHTYDHINNPGIQQQNLL